LVRRRDLAFKKAEPDKIDQALTEARLKEDIMNTAKMPIARGEARLY